MSFYPPKKWRVYTLCLLVYNPKNEFDISIISPIVIKVMSTNLDIERGHHIVQLVPFISYKY